MGSAAVQPGCRVPCRRILTGHELASTFLLLAPSWRYLSTGWPSCAVAQQLEHSANICTPPQGCTPCWGGAGRGCCARRCGKVPCSIWFQKEEPLSNGPT